MARRSSARDDARRGLEELLLLSGRGDAEAFAGRVRRAGSAGLRPRHAPAPRRGRSGGRHGGGLPRGVAPGAVVRPDDVERRSLGPGPGPPPRRAGRTRLGASGRTRRRAVRADDSPLLAAGLSPCQAHAVELAYFDGLDHLQVAALLDCAEPVPSLVTDGLELLASADSRR